MDTEPDPKIYGRWINNEFRMFEEANPLKAVRVTNDLGISHMHQPYYYTEAPDGSVIKHHPYEPIWNNFFQMNVCPDLSYNNPWYGIVFFLLWIVLPLIVYFGIFPYLFARKEPLPKAEKIFFTIFFAWYIIFLVSNFAIILMFIMIIFSSAKLMQEGAVNSIKNMFK